MIEITCFISKMHLFEIGDFMTDRNTRIPRPFTFEGIGEGDIIEEAAVEYDEWAPSIQLLRFTDTKHRGEEVLRFCYYVESGQLARRALWIDDDNVEALRKAIRNSPRVRKFLQRLLEDE